MLRVFTLLLLLERLQLLRQLLNNRLVLAGTLIHVPLLGLHLLPSHVLLLHLLDGCPLLKDYKQFGPVVVAAVLRRVLVRVQGNFLFFFLLGIVIDGSMFNDGCLLLILAILFVTAGLLLRVRLASFAFSALADLQVPSHVPRIIHMFAVFTSHLLVARQGFYTTNRESERH